MKKLAFYLLLLIIPLTSMSGDGGDAIVGQWVTAKNGGLIDITMVDGKYLGTVLGSSEATTDSSSLDINNPDPRKRGRSLIGMVTMGSFKYDGKKFTGGWIYDPYNGKTYKSILRLNIDDQLEVRGYVGIKLFGRTEIWKRAGT